MFAQVKYVADHFTPEGGVLGLDPNYCNFNSGLLTFNFGSSKGSLKFFLASSLDPSN